MNTRSLAKATQQRIHLHKTSNFPSSGSRKFFTTDFLLGLEINEEWSSYSQIILPHTVDCKENKMMVIPYGALVEKTEGKRQIGRHDIDGKIIP